MPPNPNVGDPLEIVVHQMVAQHLRAFYPDVIFNSSGDGNNLSKTQAGINKMLRSSAGYPDLVLLEPRGRYFGAFWELKRVSTTPYLKNGNLSTGAHVQAQAEVLQRLVGKGYYANFGVGADDAISQIDWYMSLGAATPPGLALSTSIEPSGS